MDNKSCLCGTRLHGAPGAGSLLRRLGRSLCLSLLRARLDCARSLRNEMVSSTLSCLTPGCFTLGPGALSSVLRHTGLQILVASYFVYIGCTRFVNGPW